MFLQLMAEEIGDMDPPALGHATWWHSEIIKGGREVRPVTAHTNKAQHCKAHLATTCNRAKQFSNSRQGKPAGQGSPSFQAKALGNGPWTMGGASHLPTNYT